MVEDLFQDDGEPAAVPAESDEENLLLQETEIEAQYDTGYNLEIENNTYEARAGANIRNEINLIICIVILSFYKMRFSNLYKTLSISGHENKFL